MFLDKIRLSYNLNVSETSFWLILFKCWFLFSVLLLFIIMALKTHQAIFVWFWFHVIPFISNEKSSKVTRILLRATRTKNNLVLNLQTFQHSFLFIPVANICSQKLGHCKRKRYFFPFPISSHGIHRSYLFLLLLCFILCCS